MKTCILTTESAGRNGTVGASSRRHGGLWRRLSARVAALAGSACLAIGAQSTPTVTNLSGPQGGPFSSSPIVVQLQNPAPTMIRWRTVQSTVWLTFSKSQGKLAPGASFQLTATVNQTAAASLAPGVYSAAASYLDPGTAQRRDLARYQLTVSPSVYSIAVTPNQPFDSSGPIGGPFSPNGSNYTITNTGSTHFDWSVVSSHGWLAVTGLSAGTLAPGEAVPVSVSLVPGAANGLPTGNHDATLSFRRASSGVVYATRDAHLAIQDTAGGWTQFTPSVDTRIIYVSSSLGNDANNGLSPSAAKRTISAGRALLRNGFPDWLLFKKGDSFDGSFSNWNLSGRSLGERMLLSSYGQGPRPLIRTGNVTGIYTAGGAITNHIAIVGLHFLANSYAGGTETPVGVAWYGGTQNFLLEDCMVEKFATNVVVQGHPSPMRHSNVVLRRNVIVDAYNVGSHNSQGIYSSGVDGLLIEENTLDTNGWLGTIAGSLPTMFRHNVYVQNGATGVVFRGNIVTGTDGAQIRPGGTITENFVARAVCGLQAGVGNSPEPGGVNATISNNVIIEGRPLDSNSPGIFGLRVSNLVGGSISNNVVANATNMTDSRALWFSTISGYSGPILSNYTVTANISHNSGNVHFEGLAAQYSGVVLSQNTLQSANNPSGLILMGSSNTANPTQVTGSQNTYWLSGTTQTSWVRLGGAATPLATWLGYIGDMSSTAQLVNYPDAARNTSTYNATLGGAATHDAFMAECRMQSKDNWRPQYTAASINAYIRAGFGM